jgi:hypothetical protein
MEKTIEALHNEMSERVAEAHRQYKRELVPVRTTTAVARLHTR